MTEMETTLRHATAVISQTMIALQQFSSALIRDGISRDASSEARFREMAAKVVAESKTVLIQGPDDQTVGKIMRDSNAMIVAMLETCFAEKDNPYGSNNPAPGYLEALKQMTPGQNDA